MISDASQLDDTLDRLADRFRGDSRVTVLRHDRKLGWIEHANLLLERSGTELFCWMPQDDLVSPADYFSLLVDALDENEDRVLAFPLVCRRVKRGWLAPQELEPAPYRRPPVELGARPSDVEAVTMLRSWNMALGCWRGVFRRDLARPIPDTADRPDLIWTFSLALAGSFIEVPEAVYLKRLHRGSARLSMKWDGAASAEALYRAEVESRLGGRPERVEEVMAEVRRYLRSHQFLRQRMAVRRVGAAVLGRPRPVYE